MKFKPKSHKNKKEVSEVNLASNFFVVLLKPLESCFGAGPSLTLLNIWCSQEPPFAAVYCLREDWTEKIQLKDRQFGETCPQYIVSSIPVSVEGHSRPGARHPEGEDRCVSGRSVGRGRVLLQQLSPLPVVVVSEHVEPLWERN